MANKALTPRLNRMEPNIVIDGGMEIWPEGTSRSLASSSAAYGAVLTQCHNQLTGVTLTNSQQASIPSGTNIPFSNQISKTAAGTLAAGTYSGLSYFVEGYDTNKLLTNEFSVIFWVKSSVASNRTLKLGNTGFTHSYLSQYNISATNTWQLKAIKIPALSSCPGTINKTNGMGLQLFWGTVVGSTFQSATTNTWHSGNFLSGVGEDTTWLTGTTHDFSIAGVMILPGDWTSLEADTSAYKFLRSGRNFQEELAKTQRYWNSSFSFGFTPSNNYGVVDYDFGAATYLTGASNNRFAVTYPSEMRAIPTITTYNPYSVTANSFAIGGSGANILNVYQNNTKTFSFRNNAVVTLGQVNLAYTSDARF